MKWGYQETVLHVPSVDWSPEWGPYPTRQSLVGKVVTFCG